MNKQAQLYCDAMNAKYEKEFIYKLLKYKKALLNIPDGMNKSAGSYQILFLLRDRLNKEIELRKEKYWSVAKPLLITIVGGIVVGIVLSFFVRQNNTNIIRQQSPQQQQGVHK